MDLTPGLQSPLTGERPRVDYEQKYLVGARCTNCETPSWPARSVCHRCGSAALALANFKPTGSLITHTTVWVPRPSLDVPYTLGQIELDGNGPVVFGHVRGINGEFKVPCPVRLFLAKDPDTVPWYWFEPDQRASS